MAAFNVTATPPTIPAGDTTIFKCANGVWTIEPGAIAAEQCCKSLLPPVHLFSLLL